MTDKHEANKQNPLKKDGALLSREVFYKGQNLMEQGASGNRAYYIENGHADVFIKEGKRNVKISTLGPGDIVGEMALITNAPRSATVTAIDACSVSVISREDMERRLKEYKDPVLKTLLEALVERLRESNLRQAEYSNDLNSFQKRMIGIIEEMPFGLSVEKHEEFKKDVLPALENLEKVLEKYKGSFLKKADEKGL